MPALFGIMKWKPMTVRTSDFPRNKMGILAAVAVAVALGIVWFILPSAEAPIAPSGNDVIAAVGAEKPEKGLEVQREAPALEVDRTSGGTAGDRVGDRQADAAEDRQESPAEVGAAVAEFNDKYLEALSYRSSAQEEWALRHGFPSRQQVAEASLMSTAELKELADGGGAVYEALYFDRLLDEAIERRRLVEQGGTDIEAYLRTEQAQKLGVLVMRQSWEVLSTDSAFAGYVLFRYYDTVMKDKQTAFGALNLIRLRGDRRIARARANYAVRNGISHDILEYVDTFAGMVERAQHGGMPTSDRIPTE